MSKKATGAKQQNSEVRTPRSKLRTSRPLYRRAAPKVGSSRCDDQTAQRAVPTNDIPHAHPIAPSHFTLREDGSIVGQASRLSPYSSGESKKSETDKMSVPRLIFTSDTPFVRLYHGNCLELLDAIAAKYPDGRFDAIFADPPYFLSNGGITCHAGKMVKVDKGDWDVSRGPELNHEFNTEWLRRCQKVLKPNGTIWVTGTHHVIFSIGYALQQLGFKILNDIAWEKPNPPPNLSCRYFTHSTETVLWAAKNGKSKHIFNYQEMRKVTGKQMKTVWRKEEFLTEANKDNKAGLESEKEKTSVPDFTGANRENRDLPDVERKILRSLRYLLFEFFVVLHLLRLFPPSLDSGATRAAKIRVHPCPSVVEIADFDCNFIGSMLENWQACQ